MSVHGSDKKSHTRSVDYTKIRKNYCSSFYKKVLPILNHSTMGKHLDIATGTGVVIFDLADYFQESIGVDFSPERIEEAKKSLQGNSQIQFQIGSADSLPFSNVNFDLITVAQAFQYFPQPQSIREIKRFLSPDGFLLIFWKYPDHKSILSQLANIAIEKTNSKFKRKLMLRKSMQERFDNQNLPQLFTQNGLKIQSSGILSFPYDFSSEEWIISVSWAVGGGDKSIPDNEIAFLEKELSHELSMNNFKNSFQEDFDHFYWLCTF